LSAHRLEAPFGTFAHTFCITFKSIWLASELFKCGTRTVYQLTKQWKN